LLGSLTYSGSLSNPGNPLDLTNPGQIGLMAYTPESFGDGLGAGGTGADPRTDNLGVSITNFTFPGGGNAVPEPATWAMMIMGFGGIGAVVRRRRGQALAA
jgi:hypothetical protein